MSNSEFLLPPESAPPKKNLVRKLGLGAALVAVPLGAAWAFLKLQAQSEEKNRAEEAGATYDLTALRKIDPALIKYRQLAQVATGMQAARAIAVDAKGQILVAGDKLVRIFSATGQRLSEIPLDEAPACVASGSNQTLIVGFRNHVEVFDAAGKRLSLWPASTFGDAAQLTGLAVRGNEVFVADSGNRIVLRCSLEGQVNGTLPEKDAHGNSGLILPSPHLNVAVDAHGEILISNPGRHRIETYTVDGGLQRFFGQAGTRTEDFLGCCNPTNFALLSDGRIVTSEKGVARVKIYTSDGLLDSVVAGPDVFGDNMLGLQLAVDASDHILVLEPGSTNIRIFQSTKAGAL